MARRRLKLVPEDGVECFEVRIVLFYDAEGVPCIAHEVSVPDGDENSYPRSYEVLGVIEDAKPEIRQNYIPKG
jgi:hypothetical protein